VFRVMKIWRCYRCCVFLGVGRKDAGARIRSRHRWGKLLESFLLMVAMNYFDLARAKVMGSVYELLRSCVETRLGVLRLLVGDPESSSRG
jgi:hypothetical protein